jgi:tagatose 1,6-diphosphate aldolase
VSYSVDANISKDSEAFARQRPEIVVETARRLSETGVDVLKMEFPVDIKYETDRAVWRRHLKATSDAATVPWVLLSGGVDFDKFEEQTIAACESGASGFLAGRAIWKEAVAMGDEARTEFLAGPATQRIKRLIDIARSHARPWSEFYAIPASTEDWFKTYLSG